MLKPLPLDKELVQQLRPVLSSGEHILWAARPSGPSWRQWHVFVGILVALGIILFLPQPGPFSALLKVMIGLASAWQLAGEWQYVFAVTNRRTIILRTLAPRSWIYLDHGDLDLDAVHSHQDEGVIKFANSVWCVFKASGPWSYLSRNQGGMKEYIDNVPNIEWVRKLIGEQAAAASGAAAQLREHRAKPAMGHAKA